MPEKLWNEMNKNMERRLSEGDYEACDDNINICSKVNLFYLNFLNPLQQRVFLFSQFRKLQTRILKRILILEFYTVKLFLDFDNKKIN